MQDQPSPAAILAIAIAHLRDKVLPGLDGRAKFDMRVTLNALQLVQRSLELQPASDAAELERLKTLLGAEGGLEQLNRELCARIRAGAVDLSTPGLAAHLRATAMEKLAVDQPSYAAYRQALAQQG
jgi:hypothetical protein